MLAHLNGQLWNGSNLAASLGISQPRARRYLDLLTHTLMIRQLQPYLPNIKKRLIKSPKVYFRDTGLLHSLLGITTREEMLNHPVYGRSWESFVIEQFINRANLHAPNYEFFFWRTSAGAEVDLLIKKGNKIFVVEVKVSCSPGTSKGLMEAIKDIKPNSTFLVHPGKDRYPLGKNIEALPFKEALENFPWQ